MPDLTVVGLTGTVLVWEKHGATGRGEPTILAYVEVPARYVRRSGRALDPKGNTIAVDAQCAVDRDVPIGSLIWEGDEDALYDSIYDPDAVPPQEEPDPPYTPTSGIMEVVTSNRAKDIKGRMTRRELGLKRFNDTLPTVVTP